MSLIQLKINNFRNIFSGNYSFLPHFNIIHGENGSGKTSLLEAIYFIGHGKSFRTHLVNQLVQHDFEGFNLFAQIEQKEDIPTKIGVERISSASTKIKINGQICHSAAELATLLPMQIVNPDSYKLLEASPKYRRKFLDWGLFHVEHCFLTVWRSFQKTLAQRNSALKLQLSEAEINIWNEELQFYAEQLSDLRKQYFLNLQQLMFNMLKDHSILHKLTCIYERGWPEQEDYKSILIKNLPKDRQIGYTKYGPQRADIKFLIDEHPAQQVLSRGQQKILVGFLSLAQGILCKQLINKTCLYLIDDLASELDDQHKKYLFNQLAKLEAQVFISGVNQAELKQIVEGYPHQMFHVEHGHLIFSADGTTV